MLSGAKSPENRQKKRAAHATRFSIQVRSGTTQRHGPACILQPRLALVLIALRE